MNSSRKDARHRALRWQIERYADRLVALDRLSGRLTWVRLGTFAGGSLVSAAIAFAGALGWAFGGFAITFVVFGVVARYHRRALDGMRRFEGHLAIKRAQLARMELDWDAIPLAFITSPRAEYPVERDIDLVGDRSLHRLLDTCVSRAGSIRLRDWLADVVPDQAQIQRRQQLVRELAPLWAFRDRLHLNGSLSQRGTLRRWDGQRLQAWLAGVSPSGTLNTAMPVLTLLALSNTLLFALFVLGLLPPLWVGPFMVYAGLYLWHVQRMGDPFELGLALRDPLDDLRAVFDGLEAFPYGRSPALRALCAPFTDSRQRPSTQLARLSRVLAAASLRRNPLLWSLVSAVIPWDVYIMRLLERRRDELSGLLPQWLDIWYELEALSALANLAYLNPGYAFPQLVADRAQPILSAQALGHPLIPDAQRVCNDVTLSAPGDLLLITGSNMSGKSTFLRTAGVNLALAYAGGPVAAAVLHVRPLRLFTCIRVTDSLADGISYFYAEVQRLKTLLDELAREHEAPVLFLIDEIFRGTNNRERLIGSRAYIRAAIGQNGVGILATHDLELVHLADDIPQITNMHFAETIVDGRMAFDYTLRPGPCPTTNALLIMRMAGLPVPDAP